jgi:hypothetical protein
MNGKLCRGLARQREYAYQHHSFHEVLLAASTRHTLVVKLQSHTWCDDSDDYMTVGAGTGAGIVTVVSEAPRPHATTL